MKNRYWFVSILVLLLLCSYFFYYFYKIELTRKIEEVVGHQKIHAKQAARSFKELIEKWDGELFYLSNDSDIVIMNDRGKYEMESLLGVLKDEIKGITRTDKNGRIIFTTPYYPNSIGADISKQKHMSKILSDHKPVMSGVFNAVQGFQAIVIHYPVFKDGQFDGTIAFVLNFGQISKEILDEIKIGGSGYAWMLSCEGVVLYSSKPGHLGKSIYEIAKADPDLLNLAKKMLSGDEGVVEFFLNKYSKNTVKEKHLAYFIPIKINNTFWSLAIVVLEDDITASIADFRNKLILIFTIVLIGGIGFSYFGLKAWLIINETEARKIAEKKLQESEFHYRLLFEQNPAPMLIYERGSLKILAVNEAFHRHYGYSSNEVYTMRLTDLYPDEEKEPIISLAAGLKGYKNVGEWHHRKRDGSFMTIVASSNDILYKGHNSRVAVITDVTDRKQVEERIRQLNAELEQRVEDRTAQLEQSNKDLEAFAYSVSHDLRAPLRHIEGFVGIIEEELKDLPEDIRSNFNRIHESSGRMNKLITDLLSYSKIGKKTVYPSLLDMDMVIKKIIKNQEMGLENRSITWKINELKPVFGDLELITVVFENLLENALKFTLHNTNPVIEIGSRSLDTGDLEYYVKDNGVGFDMQYADKLFGVFQRLHSVSEFPGTGIGLANVYQIIKRHGGSIRAEGRLNEGAVFYITFPDV